MRITEANRTGQRSRRSWRVLHAVEQAGTMGKRRAVPGDDRPPLDPIFGSGPRIVVPQFLSRCFVRPHIVLKSAFASARHPIEIL